MEEIGTRLRSERNIRLGMEAETQFLVDVDLKVSVRVSCGAGEDLRKLESSISLPSPRWNCFASTGSLWYFAPRV